MSETNQEEKKQEQAAPEQKTQVPADAVEVKTSEGGEEAKEAAKPSQPTAADLLKDDFNASSIRKAKGSKNITRGVCNVLATFNNTKVSFSDSSGNVISWSSAGKCNFRGSRKSTAYAAQVVTQDAGRVAMSHGLKEVVVKVKGPGMGRDSAIRAVQGMGITVTAIEDNTPIPHNGCRAPKRRRV